MLQNPTGRQRIGLAFVLASLGILGPLNIDMYLPSFPAIAAHFDVPDSMVQVSLTTCLIGLAVGQLVIGPISDAHGRRAPLLIFLGLFAFSSLLCALAPTMQILIAGRFLQGFTAAAGLVTSKAIVRDVFDGPALTRFFALLMVINAVAPILAPMAGGAILTIPGANHQTIFFGLVIAAFLILLAVGLKVPDTLAPENRIPPSVGGSLRTIAALLRDRSFIGYAVVSGFAQGGSFAYVSGTPFVYQQIYGVSPQGFSLLFGLNGLAIITGSLIVGRLSGRVPSRTLLRWGVTIAVLSTGALLAATILHGPLITIVAPIFVFMATIGVNATSSFSLAMARQQKRAGSAGAVIGMFPLLVGSSIAPLTGIVESSAVPMGAVMFGAATLGLIAFGTLTPRARIPAQIGLSRSADPTTEPVSVVACEDEGHAVAGFDGTPGRRGTRGPGLWRRRAGGRDSARPGRKLAGVRSDRRGSGSGVPDDPARPARAR